VSWASVSHVHLFVGHAMLTIRGTSIDTMHVIDATANGVLLDDPDAHFEFDGLV